MEFLWAHAGPCQQALVTAECLVMPSAGKGAGALEGDRWVHVAACPAVHVSAHAAAHAAGHRRGMQGLVEGIQGMKAPGMSRMEVGVVQEG